jgi:hypothetical protein
MQVLTTTPPPPSKQVRMWTTLEADDRAAHATAALATLATSHTLEVRPNATRGCMQVLNTTPPSPQVRPNSARGCMQVLTTTRFPSPHRYAPTLPAAPHCMPAPAARAATRYSPSPSRHASWHPRCRSRSGRRWWRACICWAAWRRRATRRALPCVRMGACSWRCCGCLTRPLDTTRATHPPDTTRATHPPDTTRAAHPLDTTRATHPPDTTRAAHPLDTTRAAHPPTHAYAPRKPQLACPTLARRTLRAWRRPSGSNQPCWLLGMRAALRRASCGIASLGTVRARGGDGWRRSDCLCYQP